MFSKLHYHNRIYRTLCIHIIAIVCFVLVLAACTGSHVSRYAFPEGKKWGSASKRRYKDGDIIPKGGGYYKIGKPYVVNGLIHYPRLDPKYDKTVMASWYGLRFHGRDTANGEIFDRRAITAAHPTMPLPSYARVTSVHNGHSIVVRVNDRGPFIASRGIDLSEYTAHILGIRSKGHSLVRVQYLGRAPLSGSDDRSLLKTFKRFNIKG